MPLIAGDDLPPQPRRQKSAEVVPFDGVLVDRSVTKAGCDYVRIVFGTAGGTATEVEDPSEVIDAEFIFFPGEHPFTPAWGGRHPPLCAPACLWRIKFLGVHEQHKA